MINPLDRAPSLLPGLEPKTQTQMEEAVARRLVADHGLEADAALVRAQAAVTYLFSMGMLTMWGMTDDGQVTFVPIPSAQRTQAVLYIF